MLWPAYCGSTNEPNLRCEHLESAKYIMERRKAEGHRRVTVAYRVAERTRVLIWRSADLRI
jgi:hypothetical protein